MNKNVFDPAGSNEAKYLFFKTFSLSSGSYSYPKLFLDQNQPIDQSTILSHTIFSCFISFYLTFYGVCKMQKKEENFTDLTLKQQVCVAIAPSFYVNIS